MDRIRRRSAHALALGGVLFACGPAGEPTTTETATATSVPGPLTTLGDTSTSATAPTNATDDTASGDPTHSSGGPPPPVRPCDDGIELRLDDESDDGVLAGYLQCPGGSVQRHTAVDCPVVPVFDACGVEDGYCQTNGDCPAYPTGVCAQRGPDCACQYPCETDSDCAGGACACALRQPGPSLEGSPGNPVQSTTACVPANCRTDADCDGDARCRLDISRCHDLEGFYCDTPDDECRQNFDCDEGWYERCGYDKEEQRWRCFQWAVCE